MQFIILHGSFGSQNENWFPWLREKLELDGHIVIAHDFPIEDWNEMTKAGKGQWVVRNQNLGTWKQHFMAHLLPKVDREQPLGVIAHSLAPLFLLHLVQDHELELDISICVAPFYEELPNIDWQVDAVIFPFLEKKFDWKKIRSLMKARYVLNSDNDPYVPIEYSNRFGENLEAAIITYKGAGHFNADAGWTNAPLILELCRANYPASKSKQA